MISTHVLKGFVITEKSAKGLAKPDLLNEGGESKEVAVNVYTFKVDKKAAKHEIKETVEKVFEVQVSAVNTVNITGKVKTRKGHKGSRSDIKKAYVTLKPGYEINVDESV